MSKQYDKFKEKTIDASDVIRKAKDLKAVTDDYYKGFGDAMWEAREIFMRVEDESVEKETK